MAFPLCQFKFSRVSAAPLDRQDRLIFSRVTGVTVWALLWHRIPRAAYRPIGAGETIVVRLPVPFIAAFKTKKLVA